MKDAIELESCKQIIINFVPLMPDEDRTFYSDSLFLDLRI